MIETLINLVTTQIIAVDTDNTLFITSHIEPAKVLRLRVCVTGLIETV